MMKSTRILAIIVAAVLPGSALFAQGEQEKMDGMMEEHPAKMAEMDQTMEAEMKAQDAELDKLVSEMNAATADKKVDAIAAVLSKIVEQRKTLHEKMVGMHMDMKGAMDCCKRRDEEVDDEGQSTKLCDTWHLTLTNSIPNIKTSAGAHSGRAFLTQSAMPSAGVVPNL